MALRLLSLLPALVVGSAIGACTDSGADCTPGTEGCACQNGVCYPGLVCGTGAFEGVCFPTNSNDSGNDTTGDGDTGDGDGDTGGTCGGGASECDGVCVNTQTNEAHCGGCNDACEVGENCTAGTCMGIADCTMEACPGLSYCDLGSKQCKAGCAFDTQCEPTFVCDVASHECGCAFDQQQCDDVCIPDWEECSICGDGMIGESEDCDGNNLGGATCVNLGFDQGTLSCQDCSFNTANCSNSVCGNGVVEPGEDCDGNNLGGNTCASLGLTSGTLGCVGCSFDTSNCAAGGPLFDGFESGNLLQNPWVSSAPAWSVVTTQPYAGTYVAGSGAIGHNASTSIQITTMVPAGHQIRFWHRESTEQGYDFLHFYIDNVSQGSWSGATNWTQAAYPVSAGQHVFRWTYSKDGSDIGGSDRVYIDNVAVAP